jgi:hypothetical protein
MGERMGGAAGGRGVEGVAGVGMGVGAGWRAGGGSGGGGGIRRSPSTGDAPSGHRQHRAMGCPRQIADLRLARLTAGGR